MFLALILLHLLADLSPQAKDATENDQAALTEMAQKALAKVEDMRQQKLTKPIKMGVKSKEQILEFIQLRFKEEYGPDKLDAESRLFKLQGLIPEDMDYGSFVGDLMTEQVAGFYDHIRQELYIAQWIPASIQAPIMAHELFHAIQVQEWGAQDFLDSKKFSQDEINAHAGLLEGDATLVTLAYTAQTMHQPLSLVYQPSILNITANSFKLQMLSKEFPTTASAPVYLKESLIFPYEKGLKFLSKLLDKGWKVEDFRKLYKDPPASSEQLLHPEKYITRDIPSEVEFTKEGSEFSEYKEYWGERAGEFHYYLMLASKLPEKEAAKAAEGWDGDRTVLWQKDEHNVAVTALTFDTEKDAEEFAVAAGNYFHALSDVNFRGQKKARRYLFALSKEAPLAEKALAQALKTLKVNDR